MDAQAGGKTESKWEKARVRNSRNRDGDDPSYTLAGPKGPKPVETANHRQTVPREATRVAIRGPLSTLILRLRKVRLNTSSTLTWPWSPVGRQKGPGRGSC